MVKCNFYYSNTLLGKINSNSTKVANLITDICLLVMLVSTVILYVLGNTTIGTIVLVALVLVATARFFSNKLVERSNRMLLNHQVKILFNRDNMTISNLLGEKELAKFNIEYKAIEKVRLIGDLIYIYIGNISVIVVPKTSFATQQDCDKAVELVTNNYLI